jgi:ABC-type sugar transport system ATPase subunit
MNSSERKGQSAQQNAMAAIANILILHDAAVAGEDSRAYKPRQHCPARLSSSIIRRQLHSRNLNGCSFHMPSSPLLEISGIWKYYGGTAALRGVSASLQRGEILALMGHNGAGKSTLVKILAGSTHQDSGEIKMGGKIFAGGVREARAAGIAVIYQDLSLFPKLSVAENIAGEPVGRFGYSFRAAKRAAAATIERVEANSPLLACLDREVEDLSLAMRQRVAIARALTYESKILILDEPTASLSLQDTDHLLTYLRGLASTGVGVIFVSHRLSDIRQIASRYLILRDGSVSLSAAPAEVSGEALAQAIFGDAGERAASTPNRSAGSVNAESSKNTPGKDVLTVRSVSRRGEFSNLSLTLRAGEIAVLTGLTGSGRTEFAESLVGLRRFHRGELQISGKALTFTSPRDAMRRGLVYVPEDRLRAGLFACRSAAENLVGATKHLRAQFGFVGKELDKAAAAVSDYGIRCQALSSALETLSGGNQQRVLVARWQMARARVLILDEPTAGVDVNAKAEIHARLRDWAAAGAALLVISSEADEVLELADRVLVFHAGTLVLDRLRQDLDRDQLTSAMLHGERMAHERSQLGGEA